MYHYTAIQWLFFFYFYCFFGWCFECTYVSIKDRTLTNRGFMRGPFLPIYGSGGIVMLVVSMPFQDHIVLTYFAGCVGATVLEYVTGVVMEALFKIRYWDYSKLKFNFQGHVCLGTSLSWGFLTIFMTRFLHVQVEKVVLLIPGQVLTVITLILTAGIFADFALSFKAAIDLRNVLMKLEQIRGEMVKIQKRLDVIIAVANESLTNRKDEFAQSITELKGSIEGTLDGIRTLAQTKPGEYLESVKEELFELKDKYLVSREDHDRLAGMKDFFQRGLLRSNPGMTSETFGESLKELKEQVIGRKREESRQEGREEDKGTGSEESQE